MDPVMSWADEQFKKHDHAAFMTAFCLAIPKAWEEVSKEKDMGTFKVGDRVVIQCDDYPDYFNVGDVATVIGVTEQGGVYVHSTRSQDRFEWCFTKDEVTPDLGSSSSFSTQVGGNHYKDMKIQPTEFIMANGLGFAEGNVIKYVSRYKNKNGVQDLKKARHYLDMLIEQEEKNG